MPCYKIIACTHNILFSNTLSSSTLMSALSSRWVHSMVTRLSPVATRASFVIMLIGHCITVILHSVLNAAFLCGLHDGGGPRMEMHLLPMPKEYKCCPCLLGSILSEALQPGKHLAVFGYEQGHTPITKLITVSREINNQG